MSEVIESVLDTQEPREAVPASSNSEINSEAAKEEEAEKAGASTAAAATAETNKHEERKERKLSDDSKLDKLDELSSLEQEIAKMHNIQHSAEESDHSESEMAGQVKDTTGGGGGSAANGSGGHKDSHIMDELAQATRCTPDDAVDSNKDETKRATTLEEVDLIALLKGTDQPEQPEEKPSDSAPSSIELALAKLDNVGVTIEGEGQYEIMEIDDGDNASIASPVPATQTATKPATKYSSPQVKPKLSPEQARAVALEQMADLKSHTARRKVAAAAIVSRQQQHHQKPLDIISSLNDDWNEYDSDSTTASNSNSNSTSIAPAPALKKPQPKASSQPKPAQPAGATSSPSSSSSAQLMSMGAVKVLVKSLTPKSTETLKTTPSTERASSNPESTGFKRTRVIKRKIIWDPDAPETQKSFAQYAKGTTPTPTAIEASTATATTAASPTSLTSKKVRPSTPKDTLKVAAVKRTGTPSKLAELNNSQSPPKRRSQTPSVPNGGASAVVKKKKVTEIDRLMGDEGAANMMQAVEREQREMSGGELPNKPLMRKRSLTMTGRKSAETQPATPAKKETPPKGGKRAAGGGAAVDAVFTKTPSKKRPSDSWDYVYKQRASEESMIMRRRSNSSYSSNASVNRLSLDNKPGAVANLSDDASDPSFEFLKPENKANQRNDADTPPPQTLTNDLKRGAQQQQQQQQKETKTAGGGGGKTELITVTKLEKVAQVFIHPQATKTGHNYKQQLLQKLTETLNKLAKSNDCNTVLLCVQGQQFCQGIDCQELIAATIEKRKTNAAQVATVLKTYLRTLATFPKPLLAGIVGNLNNLGVMQLPLLDYVVAAEDCTYASSYARLGQLPEGYALWQQHPKVSSQVHSRLFLLGERLHTADLLTQSNRFVDMCCEASRVNAEALAVAKLISSSTAEHFRAIKKLNQSANTANLQRLDTEFNQLTEQWPSASFQANYKRYVNEQQDI